MIVPVSSEKYDILFAEATEFLKTAKDKNGNLLFTDVPTIDSLNAYYGHMKDFFLASGAHEDNRRGYKYIMMPLDMVGEEAFEINLNSRAITVPTAFSKIGGVQADQMAELVIFSADRYFDYMDLANTLIFVQWQLPDAAHTTGATEITIKDLESTPGKIRFAWPLYNTITKHSGVVKFSIRFFIFDKNDKLVYSLNTLESNLIIKPALDPAEKINPEPWGDLFTKAIINSQYTNDGQIPPIDPSFDYPGMDMTIMDKADFVRYLTEASEAKKTQVAKLGEDDELVLQAQATVADSGIISYQWKFRPADELVWQNVDDSMISFVDKPAALPVDAATNEHYLDFRDAYYKADGNIYTGWDIPKDNEGKYDNSLFERYSQLKIAARDEDNINTNVAGTYAVVATNTIGNMKKEKWSSYCYLPGPADIEFVAPMFTVTKNAENRPTNISVNLKEDINSPTIKYLWFRDTLSAEGAIAKADGVATESDNAVDIKDLTPGWYSARVVSNLNRKDKVKGTNEAQIIYAQPVINSVVPEEGKDKTAFNIDLYKTQELKIVVDVPLPEGFSSASDISNALYRNLSYEWQYRRSDSTTWKTVTSNLIGTTNDKLVDSINNETGSITVRNIEDMTAYQYRCVVTNTLGDQSVSATLPNDSLFLVY